jgi:hypothetical protein
MLALGRAGVKQVFFNEDAANDTGGRSSGPLPTSRATALNPAARETGTELPIAALPAERVRFWTLWIALVVGGFIWQFGSLVTGFLRP